jgi:hypothetical protein
MANKKKPTKTRLIKVINNNKPSNVFSYKADNGKEYSLNLQQKKFAELYVELDGNGTEAYLEAGYNCSNKRGEINRAMARASASRLLTNVSVFSFINVLLTREGFNSENVDKQHLFLVNQHSDLSAKAKGIDMFNKLRGRYPKDQAITDALTKYQSMPDSELKEIIDGEIVKEDE